MTSPESFKDWQPDEDDIRWAWSLGFEDYDIQHETKLCALANEGRTLPTPPDAWRTWMLRAKRYRMLEAQKVAGTRSHVDG